MPASTAIPQAALDLGKLLLEQARLEAAANQELRKAPLSPVDQAAASLFNKAAKVEVGRQAVFLQDLRALAQADRERVARLYEQKVFKGEGVAAKGEDVGDIIVCDDYNASENHGSRSKLPSTLLIAAALLTGGAAAAGLLLFADKKQPTPITAASPPTQAATQPTQAAVHYEKIKSRQNPVTGVWEDVSRVPVRPLPDGTWEEIK